MARSQTPTAANRNGKVSHATSTPKHTASTPSTSTTLALPNLSTFLASKTSSVLFPPPSPNSPNSVFSTSPTPTSLARYPISSPNHRHNPSLPLFSPQPPRNLPRRQPHLRHHPGVLRLLPKHFTVLTLSRNRLTGNIPATLAKLELAIVDLSQNMLEGDASVLFGANKVNLQKINLAKNLLAFDLGKIFLG
ncbi:hypothetical protein ACSQ67_022167 [Phaseolus vulgaris]